MAAVKPPPAWMVRLNVGLLRLGLGIGTQHLLSVRGRKSGAIRSTPVSIATVGSERYIVAAFADAAWVGNVRAAGEGTLARGRAEERVRLAELPVDERGPVLRAFLRQVRGGVRFFGSADPDTVVAGPIAIRCFASSPTETLPAQLMLGRSARPGVRAPTDTGPSGRIEPRVAGSGSSPMLPGAAFAAHG